MLKSAYLLAYIGADTPENERHFAKKNDNFIPGTPWSAAQSSAPEATSMHRSFPSQDLDRIAPRRMMHETFFFFFFLELNSCCSSSFCSRNSQLCGPSAYQLPA